MVEYAKLVDITKCIGCRACQVSCKRWNQLPGESTTLSPDWTNPPKLTSRTFTHVRFKLMHDSSSGDIRWRFFHYACMHCRNPPCLSVCPTGAIRKLPGGIVHIEYDRCVGCGYCVVACPYFARHYDDEWKSTYKCHMCFMRIEDGKEPECVATCPTGSLEFGTREGIVYKAKERAEAIKGYVFGDENEEVATHMIYVSDVPFDELGFPTMKMRTPTSLNIASRRLLPSRLTEAIFGGAAAALAGFILWRKHRIDRAKIAVVSAETKREEE